MKRLYLASRAAIVAAAVILSACSDVVQPKQATPAIPSRGSVPGCIRCSW